MPLRNENPSIACGGCQLHCCSSFSCCCRCCCCCCCNALGCVSVMIQTVGPPGERSEPSRSGVYETTENFLFITRRRLNFHSKLGSLKTSIDKDTLCACVCRLCANQVGKKKEAHPCSMQCSSGCSGLDRLLDGLDHALDSSRSPLHPHRISRWCYTRWTRGAVRRLLAKQSCEDHGI